MKAEPGITSSIIQKKLFEESRMTNGKANNDTGSQSPNTNDLLLAPLRKTRQFIDGMREYIMKHHREKLFALMETQPSSITNDQKNVSSEVVKEGNDLCTNISEVNVKNTVGKMKNQRSQ